MLYLANPCGDDVIAQMRSGVLGLIDQPNQNKVLAIDKAHDAGAVWCADNGCFSDKWDEGRWWAFLEQHAHRTSTCLFAVAPDVVADAQATATRAAPWLPRIRELGYPVAYVAQDGQEDVPIPWEQIDCLFIGGSTPFKLGPLARELAHEAKNRGKWIHVGRVNSEERFRYCATPHELGGLGADSADGTFLTFGPDKNLPRLLRWIGRVDQQPALF